MYELLEQYVKTAAIYKMRGAATQLMKMPHPKLPTKVAATQFLNVAKTMTPTLKTNFTSPKIGQFKVQQPRHHAIPVNATSNAMEGGFRPQTPKVDGTNGVKMVNNEV